MVLKKALGVVSYLGTLESDNYDKVGCQIDTCELVEAHFLFVDFNVPRTNEINVDFKPR